MSRIPDNVVNAFGLVIGKQNPRETRAIIDGLRIGKAGRRFYTGEAYNLPTANIPITANEPDLGNRYTAQDYKGGEIVNELGRGTYGVIYRGQTTNRAYKRLTINTSNGPPNDHDKEEHCREVYLEAFIQTILQNDPRYGNNICRIERLYRDISLVKKPGTNISPAEQYTFYYMMEPITNPPLANAGFSTYLNSKRVGGLVPFTSIIPILTNLATILQYFRANYGFYHRDLHCGNVMIGTRDTIKIIDFGMSCVTYDRVTYALRNDRRCDQGSYDLLIFFVYLLSQYSDRIDATTIDFIRSLFEMPGVGNLYDVIRTFSRPYPHWGVYPDQIDPPVGFWAMRDRVGLWGKGPSTYEKYSPVLANFLPDNFLTFIAARTGGTGASKTAGTGTGTGTGASSTRGICSLSCLSCCRRGGKRKTIKKYRKYRIHKTHKTHKTHRTHKK